MMKIETELRIGNLILVNNEIQEVCELPLPENCTDKNTKPIELTEIILSRIGFKIYSFGAVLENFYIEYFKIGSNVYFKDELKSKECYSVWHYLTSIKYIHELQNLYFAKIGRELDTNLFIKTFKND